MTAPSDRLIVLTVAIPTYKRPDDLVRGLPRILEHVAVLTTDPTRNVRSEIVVIDNDPAATAEQVVADMADSRLRYVVEPEPGIAAARNRALDEAEHSDLLVFIDDDERPEDQWLLPLVDTWLETRAAAVMGRVVSQFEDDPDPWITAGSFFLRRHMQTGTQINVAAAGNLLLDMGQIRQTGVRFNNKFGLTGGEDTLFSHDLAFHGARIVWCEESVATDFVPRSRATRRWVLARSWSHGNTAALVSLHRGRGALSRFRWVRRGSLRVLGGTCRYGVGLLTRSLRHQARGLRTAYRGAGMVAASLGFVYQEYARPENPTSGYSPEDTLN